MNEIAEEVGNQLSADTPVMVGNTGHFETLQHIVETAMRATGCKNALVCKEVGGTLVIVAKASEARFSHIIPVQPQSSLIEPGLPAIQYIGRVSAAGIAFTGPESREIAFAAVIAVPGDTSAYLVVVDDRHRRQLSMAQTYTLRAHAAHIATMFELASGTGLSDQARDRTSEERYKLLESVAVHARDAIIITEAIPLDEPGPRILYVNDSFSQMSGYARDEVIGKTPRIMHGPETDYASRAKLREALEAWEPIEIELINYRKDGSKFWVELSIVPVSDDRGVLTHWISVQRDISERKNAEELAIRVRVAEGQNAALENEILERKRIEAELLYTAFHDGLTRLRNRAFFMDRLKSALDRESDGGPACAVLFIDLDRFKVVNDSLGHAQGDALLLDIAQRLKRCVRAQDTLARIGGDEFAILVEGDPSLGLAVELAECILKTLRTPVELSLQSVFPSCSIGIAQSSRRQDMPEDLIRDADIAMYEAKRAGYGDYAIFDVSMRNSAVARLKLQTDLRLAVERDDFELAFQPVFDTKTGSTIAFEALVRWDHPTRGTIGPAEFIPVAEEIGLIREIDRHVLREVCRQLKEWHVFLGENTLRISVNASASNFAIPGFPEELTKIIAEFDLPPACIELEITEGIFLHPSPEIASTIAAARRTGVRVALDDFGTGYSSLSYISRYPIDTIKIDKSFIDDICTSPNAQAIVELIVGLGMVLGLNIVAEGVETRAQSDKLVAIGCTAMQGYLYSKPVNMIEAKAMLGCDRKAAAAQAA